MMMSHSTMSGRTSGRRSSASRPLPTVTTSKSSSEKVSSMTFWIVMLSSASRIFLPMPSLSSRPRRGSRGCAALPRVARRSAGACPGQDRSFPPFCQRFRGLEASGGGARGALDHPDHILRRGTGQEDVRDPELLQLRDVLRRDDAADEQPYA